MHTIMDGQYTKDPILTTPARSKARKGISTRKKSCRKCVISKLRCDLAKPKCNRCAARGNVCEYPFDQPGPINANAGGNAHIVGRSSRAGSLSDQAVPSTRHSTRSRPTAESYTPAQTSIPQSPSNLSLVPKSDLLPMVAADEIRDRWLRPYISASTGQEPKQLNPHTIQYLTCVLKSYLRNFASSVAPPFVHHLQLTHHPSPVLSYCCANIRTWLGKGSEYEVFILSTMREEMEKIQTQVNGSTALSNCSLTFGRFTSSLTMIHCVPSKPTFSMLWRCTYSP